MVRPQEVRAPKEKIEILAIIEDGTQTKKGYSIALIKWKGKKGVAVRWDGDNQQGKGFPITANGTIQRSLFCLINLQNYTAMIMRKLSHPLKH